MWIVVVAITNNEDEAQETTVVGTFKTEQEAESWVYTKKPMKDVMYHIDKIVNPY
jgi:hypothetical protein